VINGTGFAIIGDSQQGSNWHIAEYIIYNRGLTDSECETVEEYLSAKWGIALS